MLYIFLTDPFGNFTRIKINNRIITIHNQESRLLVLLVYGLITIIELLYVPYHQFAWNTIILLGLVESDKIVVRRVNASKEVESRVVQNTTTSSLHDVGKYYYPLRYDLL